MERKDKVINAICAVCGILLVLSLFTWAKACPELLTCQGGATIHMKCYYTCFVGKCFGVILLVLALENLARKKHNGFSYVVIGLLMFILSTTNYGIGICAAEGMLCANTALCIRIVAALVFVAGLILLLVKRNNNV